MVFIGDVEGNENIFCILYLNPGSVECKQKVHVSTLSYIIVKTEVCFESNLSINEIVYKLKIICSEMKIFEVSKYLRTLLTSMYNTCTVTVWYA